MSENLPFISKRFEFQLFQLEIQYSNNEKILTLFLNFNFLEPPLNSCFLTLHHGILWIFLRRLEFHSIPISSYPFPFNSFPFPPFSIPLLSLPAFFHSINFPFHLLPFNYFPFPPFSIQLLSLPTFFHSITFPFHHLHKYIYINYLILDHLDTFRPITCWLDNVGKQGRGGGQHINRQCLHSFIQYTFNSCTNLYILY